jgi:hypothetical protein
MLEEETGFFYHMLRLYKAPPTRALHWVPMPMPTHAHGFWVGMGRYYCSWVGMGPHHVTRGAINFVHPCIQLQIRVKLLGWREYANQEALQAEANNNE